MSLVRRRERRHEHLLSLVQMTWRTSILPCPRHPPSVLTVCAGSVAARILNTVGSLSTTARFPGVSYLILVFCILTFTKVVALHHVEIFCLSLYTRGPVAGGVWVPESHQDHGRVRSFHDLTTTTWTNIKITRATTIAGLKTASPKTVWTDSTSSRCCNMWAPEIHWQAAEGSWYIYYSAGTSGTFDNQRTHALKSSSTNIWDSTWSYASRIAIPNRDVWAIDSTVLVLGTMRYLVYSSWDGSNQCLYISKMNSATSVGNTVKISTPTYSWEKVGANVNEGPAAIYHGGRTWIVYSASNCAGTGYTLGSLELTGSDPLNASSWTKYANPIFVSGNGNYQPGHNGFFLSPSGNQIWNVYHANAVTPGTCDGRRRTMIQQVNWNSDGTPNLGSPRALSDSIAEPV